MNNSPAYEQLIAQKLQQLPVPDMADAIWASIEMQLDNDMPTDDNNHTPPTPSTPPSPRLHLKRGASLLTAIIVIIALIIIKRQHQLNQNTSQPIIPTIQQQTPLSTNANKPDNPLPTVNNKKFNKPVDAVSPGIVDSGNAVPIHRSDLPTVVQKIDTAAKNPLSEIKPPSTSVLPIAKDTVVKKKRGAQGITDKDYKIVPTQKPNG